MYLGDLVEGLFLCRLNRFAALVSIGGKDVHVHVANSGRMKELFVEGYRVYLKPAPGDHRKTAYDLALVELGHTLASADARLPYVLVHEALQEGRLGTFAGYRRFIRESTYEDSRLDLRLEGPEGVCYVETKSVTLVVDGAGLFPDAPTIRGTKHMGTLTRAVACGYRAAVVFVVQRGDALLLKPHDTADPVFGAALRQAARAGVEVHAHRCHVTTEQVVLADRIPVDL